MAITYSNTHLRATMHSAMLSTGQGTCKAYMAAFAWSDSRLCPSDVAKPGTSRARPDQTKSYYEVFASSAVPFVSKCHKNTGWCVASRLLVLCSAMKFCLTKKEILAASLMYPFSHHKGTRRHSLVPRPFKLEVGMAWEQG